MKIKDKVIKEDKYLNVSLKTKPISFGLLDKLLFDFRRFKYCITINDGNQKKDVILELTETEEEALFRHESYAEKLTLCPSQWFDVNQKKMKYLNFDFSEQKKIYDQKKIEAEQKEIEAEKEKARLKAEKLAAKKKAAAEKKKLEAAEGKLPDKKTPDKTKSIVKKVDSKSDASVEKKVDSKSDASVEKKIDSKSDVSVD